MWFIYRLTWYFAVFYLLLPGLTTRRTNLLAVVPSVLFNTANKTPKGHRVDEAFKFSSAAILPSYKFVGPSRSGRSFPLLETPSLIMQAEKSSLNIYCVQKNWVFRLGRRLDCLVEHLRPHRLTFTWWGCSGLCLWDKPTEFAHSFFSILVSLSLFVALSIISHPINSPNNSLLSH